MYKGPGLVTSTECGVTQRKGMDRCVAAAGPGLQKGQEAQGRGPGLC